MAPYLLRQMEKKLFSDSLFGLPWNPEVIKNQ